jgi:2-oxoisovalerate dehydrogenase E1 component
MDFKKYDKYTQEEHHVLFERLLLPRLVEERMLILLRQGKISKWFSGIGQEAISVGITSALHQDEMIFPMHRNLGVFSTRDIPLRRLFAQWQGKELGFTKGRDRSFHFGTLDQNVVGMISHLGPQLSLAAGVALSYKLRLQPKVALAFTGEGGTSQGEFHEALNTAAVWSLPVIFLIENNGYGLSTPTEEQYACANLADRGIGYGMESHIIEGNNLLEVYSRIGELAESVRQHPRPILVEARTFRIRGHEEASGTKYVPQDLMDDWARLDPLQRYQDYLIAENLIDQSTIDTLTDRLKAHIIEEWQFADQLPDIDADPSVEMGDVYPRHDHSQLLSSSGPTDELRFVDAISSGLKQAMQESDDLVLMGQDIADYGGVFKITDGFLDEFGAGRVRNTPLCESAIIGIAIGLSLTGIPSMVEMQFADFVSCGFNQIVNNLAKLNYRWGHAPNVVIRLPCGGGVGAGPFHSQTMESWFTHVPGLKVIYPSSPADAKGLLLAAFDDPSPVLFFEHKKLYRTISGPVPTSPTRVAIGKASVVRAGAEATIITYGAGVHWALDYVADHDYDIEIIDLRTLVPLDFATITESIRKTSRALVLHEAPNNTSFGAELAARIGEECFELLDAPVLRLGSLDTPVPFNPKLEADYLPTKRLGMTIQQLLDY